MFLDPTESGDPNCIVKSNQQCDRMGVIYNIQCNTCNEQIEDYEEKYVGMTRTSVHNRMLSHLKDQKNKKMSSPMYRHDTCKHNGIPQKYSTTIVAAEKKIVKLSCLEGIMIEKVPDSLLLNERNEKGRGGIVRISATRVS